MPGLLVLILVTYIQRIVRCNTTCTGCGTERCAGNLVPGSEICFEIKLWVWYWVEAGSERVLDSNVAGIVSFDDVPIVLCSGHY